MPRYFLFITLVTTCLCSQCSLDYRLDRKEEKIVGAWQIAKVFYKRDNALFRDNITHRYRDDVIEFYPSYRAGYEDVSDNVFFDGEWAIYAEDYDSAVDFYIEIFFYDFFNGETFSLSGYLEKLNNNKLHIEGRDALGTYTFKLNRI